jgi:hypothetical protein
MASNSFKKKPIKKPAVKAGKKDGTVDKEYTYE